MADFPEIYLLRHGETAWSITGQHTGRTDLALTERGERAARSLRARLQAQRFCKVFASPLQRAWRTAELAGYGAAALADVDLMEWDYGDYEGRRSAEIRGSHPDWNLFEDGCPGGETLAQITARAKRVLARLGSLDCDALIVAHRDILRVLITRWIRLAAVEARRLDIAPASVSILGFDHDRDEPVIRLLNDTGHLQQLGDAATPPPQEVT